MRTSEDPEEFFDQINNLLFSRYWCFLRSFALSSPVETLNLHGKLLRLNLRAGPLLTFVFSFFLGLSGGSIGFISFADSVASEAVGSSYGELLVTSDISASRAEL